MTGMTRREADADAWALGEHPCQKYGHIAPWDPQWSDCERCGTDLSVPPEERGEATTFVVCRLCGYEKRIGEQCGEPCV